MRFPKTQAFLMLGMGLVLALSIAAQQPVPANTKKPLNVVRVVTLLAGGAQSQSVAMLVKQRGIDFDPQDDYLQQVRSAGGDDALITALKSA
jgi:hypothetical protein